jgi:hypothetical protein
MAERHPVKTGASTTAKLISKIVADFLPCETS